MFELQEEILKNINELDDVKKIKEVKKRLYSNKKYNDLINKTASSNEELIRLKKELFSIKDYVEYQKLYTKLKFDFLKINNIITSVVDEKNCNI